MGYFESLAEQGFQNNLPKWCRDPKIQNLASVVEKSKILLDLSENWSGSPPERSFHSNFQMSLLFFACMIGTADKGARTYVAEAQLFSDLA